MIGSDLPRLVGSRRALLVSSLSLYKSFLVGVDYYRRTSRSRLASLVSTATTSTMADNSGNNTSKGASVAASFSPADEKNFPYLFKGELGLVKGKGKGAFGQVHLAKHKATGKDVALKVINKKVLFSTGCTAVEALMAEVNIQKWLDHDNILPLLAWLQDDLNIYLVLEYAPGGDLQEKRMKEVARQCRFSEDEAARYLNGCLVDCHLLEKLILCQFVFLCFLLHRLHVLFMHFHEQAERIIKNLQRKQGNTGKNSSQDGGKPGLNTNPARVHQRRNKKDCRGTESDRNFEHLLGLAAVHVERLWGFRQVLAAVHVELLWGFRRVGLDEVVQHKRKQGSTKNHDAGVDMNATNDTEEEDKRGEGLHSST